MNLAVTVVDETDEPVKVISIMFSPVASSGKYPLKSIKLPFNLTIFSYPSIKRISVPDKGDSISICWFVVLLSTKTFVIPLTFERLKPNLSGHLYEPVLYKAAYY